MGFILNQINFSPGIVDTMKKEFLLALFCATLAQGGRVQHHLRCWAIDGWVDRAGMDQWCMDNCLNDPPHCPTTTSDGGGCDCNCDAGDDGCPLDDDATLDAEISVRFHATLAEEFDYPDNETNSTCVYCDDSGCYGCDPTTLAPTTTAAPDDDLTCWAINGWVDREGMDQWCMDNCLHNPPYCPSTTGDGGGCDCNCDAGDDGCPLSDDATTKKNPQGAQSSKKGTQDKPKV